MPTSRINLTQAIIPKFSNIWQIIVFIIMIIKRGIKMFVKSSGKIIKHSYIIQVDFFGNIYSILFTTYMYMSQSTH